MKKKIYLNKGITAVGEKVKKPETEEERRARVRRRLLTFRKFKNSTFGKFGNLTSLKFKNPLKDSEICPLKMSK